MRILVADDDEQVLGLVIRVLKEAGYSIVATCQTGREAILYLKDHPDTVDFVLTDLEMVDRDKPPGVSGLTVSVYAKGLNIPSLIMSGADSAERRRFGITDFLAKPFQPNDLLQAIANCLPNSAVD